MLRFILWLAYFNWFIKSDKSGRQAKTMENVAGGNFTRDFAARKFPRPQGNMAAPRPLARSQIHPASYAGYIWHQNMLRYLSLDIICSWKLTFSEQIMSVDKYSSIFLRQMEAIVYLSYAILS